MLPPQFLSPDPTAQIEPADFVAHYLAQRGLEAAGGGDTAEHIAPRPSEVNAAMLGFLQTLEDAQPSP
jgi:hypothetical protein